MLNSAAKSFRRRKPSVDEEAGMVWLRLDFGPGSLMGENAGQFLAVEADMKVMPQNFPSGWDVRP